MKYLRLNDIDAYTTSFQLSNYVWKIVLQRNFFEKDTIGKQFVRSVDSLSVNIAEGFGRYNKKDKIKFYRYSFGSMKESFDWNEKAKKRLLMSNEQYLHIYNELDKLPLNINQLIKFTNEKLTI